ncbi:MAG TPA: mechanosensitive ion channel family protein [Sphaerochaeta sp.]|nr:MAG: mechanosensitive ion channel protein MscS [Spirochaetes bacterium GWC2_52_13]HCG64039.1 mechanosensitive ion channel family protein [Sphaerochaeta sp.]HCS36073.1 mechanosensitive ion channel family protein [Sphaerochaeta sp.]
MDAQMEIRSLWESMQLWFNEESVSLLFSVVGILLILIVGKILIVVLRKLMGRVFSKSRKINELMAKFLLKIVSVIGWTFVLLIVLTQMGVNPAPILAGLGVTGFILGFAFQETIGNLLAGVMIVLNAPFRIGDYVEVGSMNGTVRDMDMMSVTLATPDNKRVIMANKLIWGQAIVNYSYTDTRRVEMGVSIAYDSDVGKAKEILWDIINSYPEVLRQPAPVIEVDKLNDSSVDLVVRPWTKPADYWTVYFRFQQEVLEKFRAAQVEIPFPQVDVHMPENVPVPGLDATVPVKEALKS